LNISETTRDRAIETIGRQ